MFFLKNLVNFWTRRTDRRRYEDDHDGGRDPRPHQDGRQRRHQKE